MFKKHLSLYIAVILLLIVTVFLSLNSFDTLKIDQVISYYAATLKNTTVYNLAFYITKLGSKSFLIPFTLVVCACLLLLYRNILPAIVISSGTLLSHLFNDLIKSVIKRERPSMLAEANATGYSFPSGHAMIPMVFYGLLLYYINKRVMNKTLKLVLNGFFTCLIIGIGLSRIVLNVHYFFDVIVGFLIGFILLQIFIKIVQLDDTAH